MILIELTRPRGMTALTVPAVLIGAALLVAACGGGGGVRGGGGVAGGAAAARQTGAAADPQEAFRQCLRQHGVAPPDQGRPRGGRQSGPPTMRPSDLPSLSPSRRQAIQACASLAPNGGRFGGRFGGGVDQSALKAFQSCMSQHGVKITSSGRPGALRSATADPKAAAAFRTCRALLPTRPAPSPSPGPS
jgi:hypothetical protein